MTQLTWETAADWDAAQSESGVVHESVANTDHDDATILKKGYSAASAFPEPASLELYYPLHEDSGTTAFDQSGNNRDATINGGTLNASGLLGTTAISQDTTDDYVDTNIAPDTWGAPTTVTFWAYVDFLNTGSDLHSPFDTYDGNSQWFTTWNDDATDFRLSTTDSPQIYVPYSVFTNDSWHFMALVFGNPGQKIYVDAVEEASDGSSIDVPPTSDIYLGAYNNTGSVQRNMGGKLWDYRVYSTELSASQIQGMYDVVNTPGELTTAVKTS